MVLEKRSRYFRGRLLPLAALLALAAGGATQKAREHAIIPGFSAAHSEAERQTEEKFIASTSTEEIQKFHRYFTAEPHPAGSPRNNELARYIADLWKQQGLEDIVIHRYDVLHSTPREVSLEMVSPVHYVATLREVPEKADADTANASVSPAYLGYSASGEVTAPVVYAHSGNPEDYELLRSKGISVRGKIVLVRYSNPYSYRGFKALTAQREGAAAILIYSDPAEDGYKQGAVFPDGPWGPETHIQRGAITYDFLVPGDPLTPGWASVPGAKRIAREDAVSLPKIIGLPLSWHDAKPLLENMGGPLAPKSWQGGLPLKYRLGAERVRVHLKVDMDTSTQPYYVTEGRIRGTELPDEWIILGNHRDAWAFGGVDPSSGTASLLELTRDLGALARNGVRLRRTLVFCSWDGEEYALTGSTEWGEQFADELKGKAIAYLNVDSSASGPIFDGSAVASLAPALVDATRDLPAPSGTLYQEWRKSRATQLKKKKAQDGELADTRIGSGSDHTVFLNFLGIPTVGLQFDGPYGVYHSMYDDYYWMNHFGDPGYRYHKLITELWGVLAMRLGNADLLPYDFEFYGGNIRQFLEGLDKSSKFSAHIAIAPLVAKVDDFRAAGCEFKETAASILAAGVSDPAATDRVNRELMQVERNWLNPDGIPGRPWFKHTLYAARYTYAHLELPGLTEAAEAGNWKVAEQQSQILQAALAKNTALLRQAAAELSYASARRAQMKTGMPLKVFFALMTLLTATGIVQAQTKERARDLGVPFEGTPGPLNAITDVAGVEVGHRTLISGEGKLHVGAGPVRTGVTAVFPRGNKSIDPVFAAWFTENGNGEMTGTTWVEESGFLENPVLITNTHSVGVVRDAVIAWRVKHFPPDPLGYWWSLPVVAETWDGDLNDINGFHVKPEDAWAAMDDAHSGPVTEGNVGGGTGMICYEFKGGIGTASRKLDTKLGGYTVGVLVQCNYGDRHLLRVAGTPVGAEIPLAAERNKDVGSIIVVLATDAPLLPSQLKRMARRVTLGLGRNGSISGDSSGDIFIAFSTANPKAAFAPHTVKVDMFPNDQMDALFESTVQATEEAVINAMVAAETMTGINNFTVPALPHDKLQAVLKKYNRLVPAK